MSVYYMTISTPVKSCTGRGKDDVPGVGKARIDVLFLVRDLWLDVATMLIGIGSSVPKERDERLRSGFKTMRPRDARGVTESLDLLAAVEDTYGNRCDCEYDA